jgi:hypothetical protein
MGGHQSSRAVTVEWLTPPEIIAALGSFELDPATPDLQPYPTAIHRYTKADDGLVKPWFGRVWLNPPYTSSEIAKWLSRMAEHDHGTSLIFARTETDAFFRYVWERATALLFLRGRTYFHKPDGERAEHNGGAPTVLCAYGATDAEILAFSGIEGQFVPLRFPRSVMGKSVVNQTWMHALVEWFDAQEGPVALDDLYRAFADHPKSKENPNWRAKLRNRLQQGPFERVARGKWIASQPELTETTENEDCADPVGPRLGF